MTTKTQTTLDPAHVNTMARLHQRISALEDANRQLQRENLGLRQKFHASPTMPCSDPDEDKDRIQLLESLLSEALNQNRRFRSTIQDLEDTMDTMEAIQRDREEESRSMEEALHTELEHRNAQVEETQDDLKEMRFELENNLFDAEQIEAELFGANAYQDQLFGVETIDSTESFDEFDDFDVLSTEDVTPSQNPQTSRPPRTRTPARTLASRDDAVARLRQRLSAQRTRHKRPLSIRSSLH